MVEIIMWITKADNKDEIMSWVQSHFLSSVDHTDVMLIQGTMIETLEEDQPDI
jgi:hypothetical protein